MQAPMTLSGRISPRDFRRSLAAICAISVALNLAFAARFSPLNNLFTAAFAELAQIFLLWVAVCAIFRRLHNSGKYGLHTLWIFAVAGTLGFIANMMVLAPTALDGMVEIATERGYEGHVLEFYANLSDAGARDIMVQIAEERLGEGSFAYNWAAAGPTVIWWFLIYAITAKFSGESESGANKFGRDPSRLQSRLKWDQEGFRIFISYARSDQDLADRFARRLWSDEFAVFYDRNISPIGDFRIALADMIRDCDCLIVLWTENSIHSDWVFEEAFEAKEHDKLLCASVHGVTPPFGFRSSQSTPIAANDFDVLISELKQMRDSKSTTATLAVPVQNDTEYSNVTDRKPPNRPVISLLSKGRIGRLQLFWSIIASIIVFGAVTGGMLLYVQIRSEFDPSDIIVSNAIGYGFLIMGLLPFWFLVSSLIRRHHDIGQAAILPLLLIFMPFLIWFGTGLAYGWLTENTVYSGSLDGGLAYIGSVVSFCALFLFLYPWYMCFVAEQSRSNRHGPPLRM